MTILTESIESQLVSCRQWADPEFRKAYVQRTGFVDIFTLRDRTLPDDSLDTHASQGEPQLLDK